MKQLLLLLTIAANQWTSFTYFQDDFVNPTGTYILKGILVNHKIAGHSGELRVKFLGKGQVAFSFFISNGYPGYESASFTDTSVYRDNEFLYQPKGCNDCTIVFSCNSRRVETQQLLKNPLSNCGFEAGVMTPAFFEKASGDSPVIQDLSQRGKTN